MEELLISSTVSPPPPSTVSPPAAVPGDADDKRAGVSLEAEAQEGSLRVATPPQRPAMLEDFSVMVAESADSGENGAAGENGAVGENAGQREREVREEESDEDMETDERKEDKESDERKEDKESDEPKEDKESDEPKEDKELDEPKEAKESDEPKEDKESDEDMETNEQKEDESDERKEDKESAEDKESEDQESDEQKESQDNTETNQSAVKADGMDAIETVVVSNIHETKEDAAPEAVAKEEEPWGGDDPKGEGSPGGPTTPSVDNATKREEDESEAGGVGHKSQSAAAGGTGSNAEDGGGHLDGTRSNNLDELMDMGTVDQEEQEALMKDEEQNISIIDSSSFLLTTVKHDTPALENIVKLVKMVTETTDNHRLQAATTRPSTSSPTADSPSPPPVKVKDEPIDEEYNQAFSSSAPTEGIKDEPHTTKELKISSVFSVEGKSSSEHSPTLVAVPFEAKPPAAISSSLPLCVVCSHCKKYLIKGQTAYQRKGSPELFCSPPCLSAKPQAIAKICHHCHKAVLRPQDLILAPVDAKGLMKDFCSPACLASFNYKRAPSTAVTPKPPVTHYPCSVCKKSCVQNKHEVVLKGITHRICSNACFARFRVSNKLNVSTCVNCGSYSVSKSLMLKMSGGPKVLCSDECLAKFKEKRNTAHACTMCRTLRPLSETVDVKDSKGMVDLFCTTGCVLAHKIQSVSASGSLLACDHCGKLKVPAYHLAMSDTTIRNFCALPCVLAYQEKHNKKQGQGPTTTYVPVVPAKSTTTVSSPTTTATIVSGSASPPVRPEAPSKSATPKLRCAMCDRQIPCYPEVIQDKDKMVFVCGLDCSDEFKKINSLMSMCEYCKIQKIPTDVKKIGTQICSFCSEGCKLLYKHELAQQWGLHCRCCAYCYSVSKFLVKAQFNGKDEEFCSEECTSKYTLLIHQMAKCETCASVGKLTMTLPLLGNPKRFCKLQCLLQFCSKQIVAQGKLPFKTSAAPAAAGSESTPVIANVVSLASTPTGLAHSLENAALQGTVPNIQLKSLGHASTQTDAAKPPPLPPPPPIRILKNKALLCRPMVQNQGVTCKADTVETEAQTDVEAPTVLFIPVPVPVYVPVPMNMYSQYCPKPMSLPLPLPVPMFLPVTLDSAEQVVKTIQQIKEKMPSDPLEADLILMAEIVAEQEEGRNGRKPEMAAVVAAREADHERDGLELLNDYINSYSGDLDADEILNSCEDSSSGVGLMSASCPSVKDKHQPFGDLPDEVSSEPSAEAPTLGPPAMDIEADMPVETLEKLSKLRSVSQRPAPPPSRRRQSQRKVREKKKGRPVADSPESGAKHKAPSAPKLESKYGIDAWERWICWRQSQPGLETARFNSRPIEVKQDVLRCTTTELSYGLCRFVMEVKRPNGESYTPDSLFYLCLGIQQHLFENGRVENIFTDVFYSKFSLEITRLLKDFKPSIMRSGYIHSRVEEEYLWECKQLGAYSPTVLLNTLLFFCSKYLGFTSVEQHRQLSFAHFMRCTRNNPDNTKTNFLRFYPPLTPSSDAEQQQSDTEETPAKRSRQGEGDVLDMMENQENPLRCPIRLYEFYLSKCSETVKQRSNVFYLHPERCCVPNSPLWFSSTSLDDSTLGAMLTRILAVRELHLQPAKGKPTGKGKRGAPVDPLFTPDQEEEEGSD